MKKFAVLFSLLLLVGAGCAAQTQENSTEGQNTQATTAPAENGNETAGATEPKPTDIQQPVNSGTDTTESEKFYTVAEVAKHATLSDCWTIIQGKVYDVTSYAPRHPGGPEKIARICGKDGSSIFEKQHGGQPKQEQMLAKLFIGTVQ